MVHITSRRLRSQSACGFHRIKCAAALAFGRHGHVKLRTIQEGERFGIGQHSYRLVGFAHFAALKRLIIDENKGIEAQIEGFGYPGQGRAFGAPTDLWGEHVVEKAMMGEGGHRLIMVILAGNRLEDPARIEGFDHLANARLHHHALWPIFDQNAVPDRMVEVPDHDFGFGSGRAGGRGRCD